LKGLLDSGADNTILPHDFAVAAGMDISGEVIGGTGACGSRCMETYEGAAIIQLAGKEFAAVIHVLHPRNTASTILIGRRSIFDKFKICFLPDKIEIEPIE